MSKYITNGKEVSSDSHEENSDKENSDKENFDEKNSDEEISDDKNLRITHIVKLIFKAHKKNCQNIFENFILYIKILTGYYQKPTKKIFQKRLVKGTKTFLKKKKTKSTNIFVTDVEIFLRKKKKRSINMVGNNIKSFKRIFEYINNYSTM